MSSFATLKTRAALLAALWPAVVVGQSSNALELLKEMSLEELVNVEVTSTSRSTEPAAEAAASIHVITAQDIRRSGARTIAEALRLAPNLEVAQSGARSWAISARGFNASFSNKLLVLIDGRTVYSPLFSGVFWDMQDYLLEDVERIEVISGPGATLWGANAVNGVVSIVTKDAASTQGPLATAGAGSEERAFASLRYGGVVGDGWNYRAYAKYFERDEALLAGGGGAADGLSSVQTGFRFDRPAGGSSLTLQGDLYDSTADQPFGANISLSGGNLLGRWTRALEGGAELRLQAYLDHTHQFVPGDFGEDLHTIDFDSQFSLPARGNHRLMTGVGYRFTRNEVDNLPGGIAFLPATLERQLFSAFIQDEISVSERLRVTVGSKFEHNDYTGWELQPSVRAGWSLGRHFAWGALSRAARTPSRVDRHLYFPATPPHVFAGGPAFDSEKVATAELGWRLRGSEVFHVAATVFFSEYDDVRTLSPAVPFVVENDAHGSIHGIELESTWQVGESWRLRAGYLLLQDDIRPKPGRADLFGGRGELFDPQQQLQLRSSLALSRNVEADLWLRFVDRVENEARGFETVPDYWTADLRLAWTFSPALTVSVVGQNLLQGRHREFGFREIERAGYAKLTWHPERAR
jgi:iron complex outermembrane recepter protein